jgi:hypothetical protein
VTQQFSQDRLNQIASRKLEELGVTATASDDGRLAGSLPLSDYGLSNPFTGNPIRNAHFVVEGHDYLRFLAPPLLAGLTPQNFFALDDLQPMVHHLDELLRYRHDSVKRLATHLHHFQLEARVDDENGAVVASISLDGIGDVVLIGDEQGVRASHLRPAGGGPNQPLPATPIELAEFADASDLAEFLRNLTGVVAQLEDDDFAADFEAPVTGEYRPPPGWGEGPTLPPLEQTDELPPPTPNKPQDAMASAVAAADDDSEQTQLDANDVEPPVSETGAPSGVTAAMVVRCFGHSAQLARGVAVLRTWWIRHQRFKLTLQHQQGRTFFGRLTGPDGGALWDGSLDIDKHPPMDEFVYQLLDARGFEVGQLRSEGEIAPDEEFDEPTPHADPPDTAAPGSASDDTGERLPIAGEIWAMNVLVERSDDQEVRYCALNAEGQPYGAARILPRVDFEAAFAAHGGGYRLLVRVLAVTAAQVAYVQLDPSYQPSGDSRAIAPSIFLSNFLPEEHAT